MLSLRKEEILKRSSFADATPLLLISPGTLSLSNLQIFILFEVTVNLNLNFLYNVIAYIWWVQTSEGFNSYVVCIIKYLASPSDLVLFYMLNGLSIASSPSGFMDEKY